MYANSQIKRQSVLGICNRLKIIFVYFKVAYIVKSDPRTFVERTFIERSIIEVIIIKILFYRMVLFSKSIFLSKT